MAIETTGSHPKSKWPGVKAWWGLAYTEHTPEYPMLFDEERSEKHYEELVQSTGYSLAVVKNQGESVSYDVSVQGWVTRVTHVVYALGYIVTWEELQDNLYEELSRGRARGNAFSMRQTKENVGANVYNRAFNSSFVGGDGKELIATDHPHTSGGTWSNELSPAADLSELALEDICIQIMGAVNDRGLRISLMPNTLIVPRHLWFEANRILKSTLQNDTANNAINVLKTTNAFPGGIVMNHYLTDTDAWFVRTKGVQHGMIHFNRYPVSFQQDNDFDHYSVPVYGNISGAQREFGGTLN